MTLRAIAVGLGVSVRTVGRALAEEAVPFGTADISAEPEPEPLPVLPTHQRLADGPCAHPFPSLPRVRGAAPELRRTTQLTLLALAGVALPLYANVHRV